MSRQPKLPLEILWAERAQRDLREITAFIAKDNEAAAIKWLNRAMEAVERAGRMPLSGRMVPEFSREELREIVLGNYRIVYRIERGRLTVLTAFEGHRLFAKPAR